MPLLPEDLVLEGSGRVVRPFPFLFNFPVEESLEFLTDVMTADDGSEQRVAVRDTAHPRRWLKASLVAIGARERLHLEAQLFGWNGKVYAVPYWQDAMTVAITALSGDSTVIVENAAHRELEERLAGSTEIPLLLWRSHEEYTVVLLESIAGNVLSMSAPLPRTWGLWTRVVPLRLMYLTDTVTIDRPSRFGAITELEFVEQSERLLPVV